MNSLLIATKPDDADSVFVKEALKKYDVNTIVWFPSDSPIQQMNTFSISNSLNLNWLSKSLNGKNIDSEFDTVWLRRPRKHHLPDNIHPSDIDVVSIENKYFFESYWHAISQNAFWINHIDAIRRSDSKIGQLQVAKYLGLSIPNTILTNDPSRIKQFISSNHQVIYKPLRSHYWCDGKKVRISYTNRVTEDKLPPDDILKLTPGIFQNKIDKAHELRVTYFGTYPVAVKLFSQVDEYGHGKTDWRSIPEGKMKIQLVELPEKIDIQCQQILKHYGLNMGCFDFIVTPDGEYIFLEVNEQGQFLWIEEYNETIPMLDIFASYVANNKFEYSYDPIDNPVRLNDFRQSVCGQIEFNIKNHVTIQYAPI